MERKSRRGRSRASSKEQKEEVREAFITAGRELFAGNAPDSVSLRKIAAHAGYTPGTIYQYFDNQRALFIAIRQQDMRLAFEKFGKIADTTADPAERVRQVFMGSVRHWLKNLDHFHVLFSLPPNKPPVKTKEGVPFGRSEVVKQSYALYLDTIRYFFDSLPSHPTSVKFATDVIVATTHGIVSFPNHTRTMDWSDTKRMAESAIEALLLYWTETATKKSNKKA